MRTRKDKPVKADGVYSRVIPCRECRRLSFFPHRSGPNAWRSQGSWALPRPRLISDNFDLHIPPRTCSECHMNLSIFTELRKCDLCGITGTPKRVQWRSDVGYWNLDRNHLMRVDFSDRSRPKDTLCMACWNKVRPIVKRLNECADNAALLRKMKREIQEWQKSQRQAA